MREGLFRWDLELDGKADGLGNPLQMILLAKDNTSDFPSVLTSAELL